MQRVLYPKFHDKPMQSCILLVIIFINKINNDATILILFAQRLNNKQTQETFCLSSLAGSI